MRLQLVLGLLGGAAVFGCSASVDVFGNGGADGGGGSPDDGPDPTTSNMTSSMGGTSNGGAPGTTVSTTSSTSNMGGEGTGGQMGCEGGPNDDLDGDAWTPAEGDCNDCDALLGPGSYDFAANGLDEDCDGTIDNVELPCDGGIALDEAGPIVALGALELCKLSAGPGDWGISGASWAMSDGAPPPAAAAALAQFHLGHGVLSAFGLNLEPRAGEQFLVLSNGTARSPGQPGYTDPSGGGKNYEGGNPPGFPKASPSCGADVAGSINDPVALQVQLRVPHNATGFSFANNFYARDFPSFVCSNFDDAFLALLAPAPVGAADGNIAVYANGDQVSLNGALFDVCSCGAGPCMAGGKTFACAQGDGGLAGTGFDDNGATGWQVTRSPAEGGSEISLRLTIYDGSDHAFSSTVILDQFAWLGDPNVTVSTLLDP